MPLDNSLNADLKLSHDRHCVLTRRLPKNDPRKFSMATPKLISRGIHRLWDPGVGEAGAPSSKRVIEDCDRAWSAMFTVYQTQRGDSSGIG